MNRRGRASTISITFAGFGTRGRREGSSLAVVLGRGALAALAAALVLAVAAAGVAQAQAPAPVRGGTLRVAAGDPGAINPTLTSSGATHPVTGEIFTGLTRLVCTQPVGTRCNYEPVPDLAQSWSISPDGLTYAFNLRQGVKWHDGQPFTSDDVVYTFKQVLLTQHPRTRTLKDRVIRDVTANGPNQVIFSLNQPYSPLLLFLDEDNGAILPKHLFEGTDPRTNPRNCATVDNCQKPIGTGPFKFESRGADRITLARNDDYYEPGRPYLDGIVFRFISGTDATTAFEKDQIDLINPAPQDIGRLRNEPGTTITEEGREGFARVVRLIPNLRPCTDAKAPPVCVRTGGVNPFADKNVRKAISYAIDREEINRVQYGGLQKPATGPLTRFLEPFYNPNTQPQYNRDIARANQLLDAAGLARGPGGVRFQLTFIHDPGFAQAAAALKRELAEVGIDLTLDSKPFNDWVRQLYIDRSFDLGYSNITDPADPEIGLRRTVTCDNVSPPSTPTSFNNGAAYCNPALDSLFNQAAQQPNEGSRAQLYFQIQDVIADEQPNFYLVDGIGPYAYNATRFRGFEAAAPKTPYYFGRTVFQVKSAAGIDPENPGTPGRPTPGRPGDSEKQASIKACKGAKNAITATSANDRITGTRAGDNIFAGAGKDVVDALAGNDCVDLGADDDRGEGGKGDDRVRGDSGDDRVSGNDGNDKLLGQAGRDRVLGGDGRDGLSGGSGNDRMDGGSDNDRNLGGEGNDDMTGGPGNDRVDGGSGSDRVSGGSGVDRIFGGAGNDRIDARDGRRDKSIACGKGRDIVIADAGDQVAKDCEKVLRKATNRR